ncbi:GNAT family N-acetyltransferase [Actinokineospora bangkokensis]|uniref:N-acetyltransferase domain-containing protein n=1 Tax=Actinokineospora bangkokensis TaxID=1193682 RepID=A0A1Q9LP97_9PSEU|nr:GNAT family N-acetyltransferase [Actinokineospora bangkokensis]OLR93831.1 hypothetical protein BJP25_16525 [Actinokineospora bangkokensis]
MIAQHFPPAALVLRTPDLELRLPDHDELGHLADVAARGIHDPAHMPFTAGWTDADPAAVALSVIQFHWRSLADCTPQRWTLQLAAFHHGHPIGVQEITGRQFPATHEVHTGSWLGLPHQGRGLGTQMRAAVLHLAFADLHAEEAVSAAMADNPQSLAVSRKLGYTHDGTERVAPRGTLAISHRLRLTRHAWDTHRTTPVTTEGTDALREFLGL